MENIILVGMPGAGKSSIGVVLAKIFNMDFCDTDLIIQKKDGRCLQDIIDKEGLSYFLSLEENVILESEFENSVIATGGSVILSKKAMEHLKKKGKIVYLKLSYDAIEKRITNLETRGIAFKEGESLKDMFDFRLPLYEKYADITIDCENKMPEENIEYIRKIIKG